MVTELCIAALFITGLYTLCLYEVEQLGYAKKERFLSKMPLWFLSYYSKKLIGEYWSKPLFTCNVCMSSFWGIVFYCGLVSHSVSVETLFGCTIFIIALSGINKLIYEKYLG